MSYIGRGIDQIDNISSLDVLTFNGSSATFNLTQNSVAFTPVSADALQIMIDGILQSNNYTVSGSTVTFDFTPSGSSVCNGIRHFGSGVLTAPSDGSVTSTKLGNDSVTNSKIQNDAVTVDKLNLISTGSVPSLEAKGTSGVTEGYIQLNCAENSHGIKLKSPPHSAGASYTLTFPNNDGNANQFLQTNGSGVLSFADAGGTLVQVGKNTLGSSSGSIIVDNCFTSTYTTYMIVMRGICNDADGNSLRGRFRTGGGSGSSISSTHYRYACRYFDDDGSVASNTGVSQAQFQISNDSLAGARYLGYSGVFYIHQPHSTSFETRLHGQASFVSTSLSDLQSTQNAIHLELTTSVTGIELFYTGGNVESNSQIVVYGVNVT